MKQNKGLERIKKKVDTMKPSQLKDNIKKDLEQKTKKEILK